MKWILYIQSLLLLATAMWMPIGARPLHRRPVPPIPVFSAESMAHQPSPEQIAACLVEAIVQVESGGDPLKVGRHGERGLMQIKSGTWRDMTTELFGNPLPFDQAFDPALNRRVGIAYLAFLQKRLLPKIAEWKSDERSLLLAAYNAGPGKLRQSGFDLARMPRQTRDYVDRAGALHDVFLDSRIASFSPRRLAAL